MAHFAKVENGKVVQVIVAEQHVIDSGLFGNPSSWIQTSYNTRGNVHYGQDGEPDGAPALRANYAGVGYTYDSVNDVFYSPSPFQSWVLNKNTWTWEAPVPMPVDGNLYRWDEAANIWVKIDIPSA